MLRTTAMDNKYIKVKLKQDFHNLKKDEEYDFEFKDGRKTIILSGPNGSGKSSLVNIIRAYKDDTKNDRHEKLGYTEIRGYGKMADIDTNFKRIFYLTRDFDDPMSMNNFATATAAFVNGGFFMGRKSTGERLKMMFNKFLADTLGFDEEKKKLTSSFTDDDLLILDEMDTGYDLQTQVWYSKFLRALSTVKKVNLLVITHSPLVIMDNDEVFSFFSRQLVPSEIFLFETCGLDKYKFFGKPEKSTEEKMNEMKKKNNGINNDKG